MKTIGTWLASIGLADYESVFSDHRIDTPGLFKLTDRDLAAFGIVSVGHRRKLMRAIADLAAAEKDGRPDRLTTRDPAPARAAGGAERRQITAVFCDLVGSTALFARLDPEDVRDVLLAYQRACATVVRAHDGFIAKHLGDGILMYFGYPHAQEDDAERAVSAALDMIAAVGDLETRAPTSLRVRVGVATGTVVVGDLAAAGAAEETAVGETPNLAFRLQIVAEPNSVVVSETTKRLVAGVFELRQLGVSAGGAPNALDAWAVASARPIATRFAARPVSSPDFVGRDSELDDLLNRKRLAFDGHGQAVLITGEPGVGKSRIVAEVFGAIAAEPHVQAVYQCTARHRDTPLHPFIAQIERAAGLGSADPPSLRLDKLEALFGHGPTDAPQLAPIMAELLSIPALGRYPAADLAPAQRRRRLFAGIIDQLVATSQQQPILILVEDAHWADATTHELLESLVGLIAELPILVIVTTRPGFQPRWAKHVNAGSLALGRLDKAHAGLIVEQLGAGVDLPAALMKRIVAKTDGIPLFIEELTKAVLEYGRQRRRRDPRMPWEAVPKLTIPTTLQGSLMARLDRLGTAKEIAQIGSAIGREFSYRLMRAVTPLAETELQAALANLQQAELLVCTGAGDDAVYTFKHALVQDAAYDSMVKSRRLQIHRQVATELRDSFPELAATEPEVLAHHFAQARESASAVEWWTKAGEQALRRSAYHEARSHLENAIATYDPQASELDRSHVRLRLQADYGNVLIALLGHSAPETTAAFARIAESASGVGDTGERFAGYYGMWVGSFGRGDVADAAERAAGFAREAELADDPTARVIGQLLIGSVRWCQGDYQGAVTPLETALAAYDPERDRQLAYRFGQDIGVSTMMFLALTLWPLGATEGARRLAQAAVDHADKTHIIHNIAYAHFHKAIFEAVCNEPKRVLPHAAALLDIAHEHDLQLWYAGSVFLYGWAQWHTGERGDGEAAMKRARGLFHSSSANLAKPLFAALWAEVKGVTHPARAARALESLLAENAVRGLCWLDSELHRRRAGFLLRLPQPDVAGCTAALRQAIAVAREQQASTFERRAEIALSQALEGSGKPQTFRA